MIDLTIDAGATAGVGGNPLKLELVALLVNNEDKKIDIQYKEYALIDGEKVKVKVLSYSLIDGVNQTRQDGTLIQAKNVDGTLAFEEDGVTPKYLTQQFTRWASAFKPYLWDAAGTLKDGIKEDYGI
jgi:hypothetical protein